MLLLWKDLERSSGLGRDAVHGLQPLRSSVGAGCPPARPPTSQRPWTGPEVSGMVTKEKPYSVLITDDDPGSREALRDIVEPEGYQTRLASSGEEALDILREEPIHLALFDVHMPRMTGPEAVQIARQINAVLPVILVTADANE